MSDEHPDQEPGPAAPPWASLPTNPRTKLAAARPDPRHDADTDPAIGAGPPPPYRPQTRPDTRPDTRPERRPEAPRRPARGTTYGGPRSPASAAPAGTDAPTPPAHTPPTPPPPAPP
ncbi:MAG: hypothetical protein QOE03_2136, partial [Micromonosporaceae bacterium]|nr:hypothetical protein [Micromonosporaceae bacterium]